MLRQKRKDEKYVIIYGYLDFRSLDVFGQARQDLKLDMKT